MKSNSTLPISSAKLRTTGSAPELQFSGGANWPTAQLCASKRKTIQSSTLVFDGLTYGRYDGVQAITSEAGVTGSYVTRVVYLSCLAPDLAMRILKGEHPQDLTARKLLDWVPLPERWEDQRKLMALNV